MCKIRSIFALWCCLSLLYCSSTALAQEGTVSYPFVTEGGSSDHYPVFGLFPAVLSLSGATSYSANYYNLTNNGEGDLSANQKNQLFLAALEKKGFKYQLTTDFGIFSNSNIYGYIYEVPGNSVSIENSTSHEVCVFFGTSACVFYRLTPQDKVYDVLCFWTLAGTNADSQVGSIGVLYLNSSTSELSANSMNMSAITQASYFNSYTFAVTFRARLNEDDYTIIDTDTWGLPIDISNNSIMVFTGRNNSYWNTPTRKLSSTDYLKTSGVPSAPFSIPVDIVHFPPANQFDYNFLQGTSGDFNTRFNADTDNGGMLDIREWFQTDHDLLDPADDGENTESLPLPDPEEGESVVDIGKDTVERYGHYWDDSIGDENELPTITPTSISYPDDITPEDFDIPEMVDSAQERLDYHMERTAFKTKFDSLFAPLSNSDQKLTWTFNPSVHTELADIELANITIDPQEIVQDQNYGPYFTTFRGCLVLFEFMCFIYGCYKMVLSDVSGTGRASASEDET